MSLNTAKKYLSLDCENRITISRIRMIQASSFSLIITLFQGDNIVDLTDVNSVFLTYSDDISFSETIIGSVYDIAAGQIIIDFTPANTNYAGSFEFFVTVADTINSVTTIFPYGLLILMEKAGTGIQQTLPTTGVTVITNCASSPLTLELTDHSKTFIMDDSLTCDFEFLLPEVSNPDAYIGTYYNFVNRTSNICTITAYGNDTIDDSGAGGSIQSTDESGTNPNPWCSITTQLCCNVGGQSWWHNVNGRRVWSTTT
jgi:hypothetical protein